jgi:hypothetical protein
MQILQKWKTIFIKIFTSYLCAIFSTGASHDITHNIKISYRGFLDFEIWQIWGFYISIFHAKIIRN